MISYLNACDRAIASRWFWVGVLVFRLWNSLFVRTSFNPDEYWQSTEIAHKMVFGYGYMTWEWQEDARIRGFAHPSIFACLFKLLAILGIDTRWMVAYAPRLLQAHFAALNDYFVHKLALVYFDRSTARWALGCNFFSWFIFYVMVRPYSNSIETVLTTAALANWPWAFLSAKKNDVVQSLGKKRCISLSLAAIGVLIRPTNAVLWVFLGLCHLVQSRDRLHLISTFVLPIAAVTTTVMIIIDRVGYGVWTFVPFNFFHFNVLEGKDKLYGVHPWSWYFFQGYPAILGTAIPLFVGGLVTAPSSKKELGGLVAWTLFVYSWSAHKEFRFVLPLLPPALVYAGYCLRNLEKGLYVELGQQTQRSLLRVAVLLLVVPNVIAAVYLSRWHQRAPIDVMDFLAKTVEESPATSIHFWTPCHATPYYSFLHQNISLWFPDCSPVNRERPEGSESQQLDRNPAAFLESRYTFASSTGLNAAPDIVVMFSATEELVQDILTRGRYLQIGSFYHSQLSGDADEPEASAAMLVYRRQLNLVD